MKKSVLGVFLLITTMSFVSAQGSIADLLSYFNESDLVLASIFIVEFSLLFFALQKAFKNNNAIAGVISAVISVGTIYYVNLTGFDFSGFFLNLGISSDIIMTIIPIIIVIGVIFAIIKLRMGSLFVFGALLIVLGFFVYQQVFLWTIGTILLFVGLFFLGKKKLPKVGGSPKSFTNNFKNNKNTANIQQEEQKVAQEEQKDKNIVQEGRKEEAKRGQQSAEEVKRLAYSVDADLKNMINEYNRVQREDPNNSPYLIQLRDRILKLRDELKKLRGG